jgi:hypothetical protein
MINRLKKHVNRIFTKKVPANNGINYRFLGTINNIVDSENNDVFVVSFPKFGSTLMQHIITHLVYGINENCSRTLINLLVLYIYVNSHYF